MISLCVLLVAAVASASDVKKVVETKQVSYQSTGRAVYHGAYPGKCGNDGLYYNDYSSFVVCTNGNAYIQQCAPGSKNSGLKNYNYGNSYSYRDFCDVNLVDDGYTLYNGGYNTGYHGNAAASYGHNAGYGVNTGYGYNNVGYGYNNPGYGYNSGYGGYNAGYGPVNNAYGSFGYNAGFNSGYGDNGYRGNNGYAGYGGYGDKTHGASYQKTEYKSYGAEANAH
ncbi:hypothetical protein CAPTEDRAFT_221613 [Capitella teleta]|uniref:Chitin-binding type-2 domain-containing protein n=1 Tax=Capitella teleta TaxID=283909 RepID=R7UYT2_CAPTE|nr:hypothetical protein CAPTEDRAFT_221613 [Capitella teleta]|eukprot:ELU11494.1 hypothetical protein CAPTEDRAFT_221613 [Capitella teleta]